MSDSNDLRFVKKASSFVFPEFRMLSISKLWKADDMDKRNLEKFLQSSIKYPLKFLKVTTTAPCYATLQSYQPSLIHILSSVKYEVFFERMCFNNQTLKFVMEQCHNAKRLIFWDCLMEIDDEFELDRYIPYNTQYIDLFNTISKTENCKMDYEKLIIFLEAMSRTHIRKMLDHLCIKESSFPTEKLVQELEYYRFKTDVIWEMSRPLLAD